MELRNRLEIKQATLCNGLGAGVTDRKCTSEAWWAVPSVRENNPQKRSSFHGRVQELCLKEFKHSTGGIERKFHLGILTHGEVRARNLVKQGLVRQRYK